VGAHGLLVVDKPTGLTSHDVVQLGRKALQTRAVGHAGTLDPAASGVLVLAIGEATKLLRYLVLDDKHYEVVVRLGQATDTLDADGSVVATAAVPALEREAVERALAGFVGEQLQVPPLYSAIKQQGVPLHARARRGESVELAPRSVSVHSLELLSVEGEELGLRVHCGKGFYVRSLARDLALALGSVGHVRALRRTRSGAYALTHAVSHATLIAARAGSEAARSTLLDALIPVERALAAPAVTLDEAGVAHARHGRPIPIEHVLGGVAPPPPGSEPVLLFDQAGKAVALGRMGDGALHVVRGVTCD